MANGRRPESGKRERLGYLVSWLPLCLTMVPAVAAFSISIAKLLGRGWRKEPLPWLQLSPAIRTVLYTYPSRSRGGNGFRV